MRLILIAVILNFTRHGVIFPFIPLLSATMGVGPSTIGFIVGAFNLVAVFLAIPIGGLVDRLGVKRLLVFGVICNIASAAILLNTDTVAKLIAAQLIAGIALLLHVVASQTFVSRLPDASQRERGFGWLSFAAAAGHSVGPILGGILVDRFDYQVAFWVVLMLSSGGLILLGLKKNAQSDQTKISYSPRQDARQVGAIATDPKAMMILFFTFAVIFAASLRSSFLPLLLRAEGLTEFTVGMLISVFAITATTIRLVFGRLLALFDRKKILAYSISAIILAVSLLPSMASVTAFTILIAIFGLGFGMTQPLSMVMMSDLINPSLSGLAMGMRFSAIMLAGLLGPIIFGLIIETIGLSPAFYAAAVVVALAGIRMFVIRPDLIPARRP